MPDLLPRLYAPRSKPKGAELDRDHPLARGLVGLWTFSEGGGAAVYDKVAGYAGSVTSPAWTAGPIGAALSFDGSSTAVNAGNVCGGLTTGLTIAVWFYWNAQQNTQAVLVDKGAGSQEYRLKFTGGNTLALDVPGTYPNNETATSSAISAGSWHFAVATDGGGVGAVYVDGQQAGVNNSFVAPGAATSVPLFFGNYSGGSAYFNGKIAYVGIWNRALSAQEVTALTAEPFAMLRRPSIAWETVAPPAGSTLTDLAAMQALLSGAPKALSGQQALLQKTQAAAAGAQARLVQVAADDSGTWPKLPAFSANNFLDHFDGSSLDATKWASLVSGGTITVTDSYADFSCAASQAAGAYHTTKLDTTKSQLWTICWSPMSGVGPSDLIQIANSATAPTVTGYSTYNPTERMMYGFQDGNSDFCHAPSYYDATHTQHRWDGTTNTWTTSATAQGASPVQQNDYYVTGLEIDGVNQRFRWLGWGLAFPTAGTWTSNQGWRLFLQTDWVNFSSMEDTSNLWLILGNIVNSNGRGCDFRYEWVRYAECLPGNVPVYAWAAAKASVATGHDIRLYWSYDGVTFVPQDRTTLAVPRGGSYDAGEAQEPRVVFDGTTYTMFYMSSSSGGQQSISLATAASPTGTWTKYASNPILQIGTAGSFDDTQIGTPTVVLDQTEPNASKRWKMLYNAKKSDGKWRTGYATAPAATGPWTKQGLVIDVGASTDNDALWARAQSVVRYNNQWEVWYEGHSSDSVDHLLRAVGTDLGTLTKDGMPTYRDAAPGQDQALTADLSTAPGRTVVVADTSTFQKDGMVILSQSSNMDTYSTSRIRKVVDATHLELYHGLTGFTASYPTRIKQLSSSQTWNVRDIRKVGGEWWFYTVPWEPFASSGDGANYAALLEQCSLMKHAAVAPSGAQPVYDLLSDPVIPRGFNNDAESVENMTLIYPAFTASTNTATATTTALFQATKGDLAALAALLSRTGSDTAGAQALLVATRTTQAGASGLLKGTFGASAGTAALLSGTGINIAAGQQAILKGTFTGTAAAVALFQKTSAESAQAQALFLKTAADVAGATALLKGTGSPSAATRAVLKGSFPTQAGLQAILQHTRNANSATEGLFSRTGSAQAGATALITGFTGAVAGSVVLLQAQRQAAVSLHALFQRTSSLVAETEAIFTQVGSQQAGAFTILSKQRSATTWAQGLLQGTFAAQAGALAVIGVTIRPARATLSDAPLFAVTVGDDLNV